MVKTINEKKKENYDQEALQRFICEGLNGKGCGTEPRTVSSWRKEKTWEEKQRDFLTRDGD